LSIPGRRWVNFAGVKPTKYSVPHSSPVHLPGGDGIRRHGEFRTPRATHGDLGFPIVAANRRNLLRPSRIRYPSRDYRLTTDALDWFNLSLSSRTAFQKSAEA